MLTVMVSNCSSWRCWHTGEHTSNFHARFMSQDVVLSAPAGPPHDTLFEMGNVSIQLLSLRGLVANGTFIARELPSVPLLQKL